MRTMSKLRALCAHPDQLQRPSSRRDAAAADGKLFHAWVEAWRRCAAIGEPVSTDQLYQPLRGWADRMREVWTPPDDLEVEVALGLAEGTQPF